eukprot:156643_1
MSDSQTDGAYLRLNSQMLNSGNYDQTIVSIVGKTVSYDGMSTLEFECVDGGKIQVQVGNDFTFAPGRVIEIMGAANPDKTVQHFISRELGDDFDFANY